MKRKKIFLAILTIMYTLFLSGCSNSENVPLNQDTNWEEQQIGYAAGISQEIAESPKGYYFLVGGIFVFCGKGFIKSGFAL